MQARIFSAALQLLVKKQIDDISMNDLIDQVNASRGTLYKYFDSLSHVFRALSEQLATELAPIADQVIVCIPNAALRVATGTRLILNLGSSAPLFGKLMLQSGWPMAGPADKMLGFLERDIQLAITQGEFEGMPNSVAVNLVIGPTISGLHTMLLGQTMPDYAAQLTVRILRSLGMSRSGAEQAVLVTLPQLSLPFTGLIGEILRMSATGV